LMKREKNQKIFYYSDNRLQVREIKWFRLKVVGVVAASVICCLAVLILGNYLYNNFLGLGNSRMSSLIQENRMLEEQLAAMKSNLSTLQSALDKIDQQGNQMRLMVDLKPLDAETKAAGTGGAVTGPELNIDSDSTTQMLKGAMTLMQRLSSEIKVQEQSYEQIVQKYSYNKEYFAALPALKPMDGYYRMNEFGPRIHPVLGVMKMHEGLDIVNDVGTPVYAAGDGVVEMTGHTGGGFGLALVIRHGFGYQTVYAHLSKFLVREGQHVKRGELIAKSGRSGLVSGPHLHYEVRHNGVCQNPSDYFFDDISARDYREQIASH